MPCSPTVGRTEVNPSRLEVGVYIAFGWAGLRDSGLVFPEPSQQVFPRDLCIDVILSWVWSYRTGVVC